MMYNLENHRGFCVVMVIECSVASGEMEFGERRGVPKWKGGENGWVCVGGGGAILIAFRE